jgi:tetratricopeptide (TPR) repeat protein
LSLTLTGSREKLFFNDRRILLERKKLAILFFILSLVFIFIAFSSLSEHIAVYGEGKWKPQANRYLIYMAMKDCFAQRYSGAIQKYERILQSDPNNIEVLTRIAATYQAVGDKKKAAMIFEKIITINQVKNNLGKDKPR